jgi:hypothetical protein
VADSYGPDGYGPPPSPEVAALAAEFFDDDKPPPTDPELRKKVQEALDKRVPAWSKKYGRR